MDEKVEAQKPTESTSAGTPPPTPPPIDPPPVAESAAPERDDPRKKMSTSDWIMSIATIVIALGTIVSAAAIFLQWREMVNGGADTTAIKNAAQKQADAAKQFADTADNINGNINDAVAKLQAQAGASSRLATVSAQSATTSKSLLDLEIALDRASISAQNPVLITPATPNAVNQLRQRLVINFQNTGRTPATNVSYFIYPDRFVRSFTPREGVTVIRSDFKKIPNSGSDQWVDLPDIPGSNFIPVSQFLLIGASPDEVDLNRIWAGRIEYADSFGQHHGKEFCIQLRVIDIRPNQYETGYCPAQGVGFYDESGAK